MDGHTAGFPQRLVVEARLTDLKDVPVVAFQRLVDVDDVEIAVLSSHHRSLLNGKRETGGLDIPSTADARNPQQ